MKPRMVIVAIGGAVMLAGAAFASLAQTPGRDIAVVDLTEKTKMQRQILQGKYIFVHDDEAKAKGEPCFLVYKYSEDAKGQPEVKPENLVVSCHCQRIDGSKAQQLILTYTMVLGEADLFEIKEVQFAGSTAVHRLPKS